MVTFSDLNFDARVTRQLQWLGQDHEVTCVCFEANRSIEGINWQLISQTPLTRVRKLFLTLCLLLRFYSLAYRLQHDYIRTLRGLLHTPFDWLIANDIESIPLVFALKTPHAKVLFDAHEFAPRHLEERRWWRVLFKPWHVHLCATYIPQVDQFCTVSDGLADEYESMFNRRPVLITNATKYHDLSPSQTSGTIRLIHHGIVNRSRKLELMMRAAALLGEGYQLDLILMLPESASAGSKQYLEELKALAAELGNVKVLEPMLNKEIVPFINQYDIGLFLLEPINFNYTFALPNKLFDFIQARLAIAIGPSIEMTKYVEQYALGIVSKSFDYAEFSEAIASLSYQQIDRAKINSHKIAMELSEESNKSRFLSLLKSHV